MRSFAARGDCRVSDEPLYAAYLSDTGLEHPMRDEVLASQSRDWREVVRELARPQQGLWYQKHMTHHLLPHVDRAWLTGVQNLLLIRHPRAVVASYARSRTSFVPDDLGVRQQAELLDHLIAVGHPPVVLDAAVLLRDPPRILALLCERLGIPYTPRMLAWPSGAHPDDGVWGEHWYASVRASTGFGPEAPVPTDVGPHEGVVRALLPAWSHLESLTIR
ncbi:MAG: HAD family hydrolase [Alphaproteobacteria bacterium]|nr:HAD family hydrolase [Alphaproteobacteria bacterium]